MTDVTLEKVQMLIQIPEEECYPLGHTGWFQPAFSPKQCMLQGVFGINYFSAATEEDFQGMNAETEESARANKGDKNRWSLNCFGVKAGMDYAWWKQKGLITPEDPLGWFHWYCRYYSGRRIPQLDRWQIARWQNFNRWLVNGQNQFHQKKAVSPVVLQSLLQWAYDPRACFVDKGFNNVPYPININDRKD